MIKVKCRKCGSENIKKNGKTYTGKQKFHCKDCKFYGTLDTKDSEIKEKERLIEKLLFRKGFTKGYLKNYRNKSKYSCENSKKKVQRKYLIQSNHQKKDLL